MAKLLLSVLHQIMHIICRMRLKLAILMDNKGGDPDCFSYFDFS